MISRTIRFGFHCALALGVTSGGVRAQMVRGSVLDSATHAPLTDAVVTLVDMRSAIVAATLAGPSGEFALRAPAAGTYRIRLQRIGYRLTLSDPIVLDTGATIARSLAVASVPVALSEVSVVGRPRCVVKPAEGEAVADAWSEAQKALFAAQLGQSQHLLRLVVRDAIREWSPDLRELLADSTGVRSGRSESAYRGPSPDTIARLGYVSRSGEILRFFAPGADVLLSEQFAATHCFRLAANGDIAASGADDRDSLLTIAFEPVGRSNIVDIRGQLRLDRRSGALRSLRYQYTHLELPPAASPAPPSAAGAPSAPDSPPATDTLFGGELEFAALPGGAWMISRWTVRAPRVAIVARAKLHTTTAALGMRGRASVTTAPEPALVGVHEEGGEVLDARTADGTILWTVDRGAVPRPISACERARRAADAVVDSTLHAPVSAWLAPLATGPDSAALVAADAILELAIDTAGRPEPSTARAIRVRSATMLEIARLQLARQHLEPREALPGCRVRHVVSMPFVFSRSARD